MEVGLSSSSLHLRMPCGRVCVTSQERDLSPLLIFSLQVVLNQKFTDCFVLVFLDSHLGKTVRTSRGICVSLVEGRAPNVRSLLGWGAHPF